METEFTLDESFTCNHEVVSAYWKHGYILIRNLLNSEEVKQLEKQIVEKEAFKSHIYQQHDGKGTTTKKSLWSHPGSDVTGMIARSEKLTGIIEKLLGKEIYHYHGKIQMKEPHVGGTFQWHQDYGYWYNYTCLCPDDLLTVFIPIDRSYKENGGLQVLDGSHKFGRIDHSMVSHQNVADSKRVELIEAKCDRIYTDMNPGDAFIFNSNVLHTSGKNTTADRRYAYLVCFNTKENSPSSPHPHAAYTPLVKVPDSAIVECQNYMELSDKEFMLPDNRIIVH